MWCWKAVSARGSGRSLPLGAVAAAHPQARGGTLRIERDVDLGIPPVPMTHEDSRLRQPLACLSLRGPWRGGSRSDRATGQVRVLRVVAVHDAGTVVNPAGAEGQVVGGVAMGLGMALGEQLLWADGRPHVTGFTDYPMPRADGMPPVEVAFVGKPDPRGPAGAKSISEIALMPVAAAVANAVAHATGARLRELPMTPDRVLAALPRANRTAPAPLAFRPSRWWAEAVRRAYPRGLLRLLDRYGPSRPRAAPALTAIDRPGTAAEAVALLADGGAHPIGGGTDLLPARAAGLAVPERLVSLARCADLRGFSLEGDLVLGAGLTLEAAAAALAGANLPGDRTLAAALGSIATPQIRAMATLGGNLCQANRCWFLRSGFDCYERGGFGRPCYAVTGDHRYFHAVIGAGRCQSVTPSDLATVLVALDGMIAIQGRPGLRWVPARAFFTGPGESVLRQGEIVTALRVPAAMRRRASAWGKLQLSSDGFAIASACASLRLDGSGAVQAASVVLGGVAATPWRARDAEKRLIGRRPGPDALAAAAEAWISRAHPLPGNRWKLDATAGLLRRVLGKALDGRERRNGRTVTTKRENSNETRDFRTGPGRRGGSRLGERGKCPDGADAGDLCRA